MTPTQTRRVRRVRQEQAHRVRPAAPPAAAEGMIPVPVDAPPHVVVTPDPRVWSVQCRNCGELLALYVFTIQHDPGVVQRCIDEHADCLPMRAA